MPVWHCSYGDKWRRRVRPQKWDKLITKNREWKNHRKQEKEKHINNEGEVRDPGWVSTGPAQVQEPAERYDQKIQTQAGR